MQTETAVCGEENVVVQTSRFGEVRVDRSKVITMTAPFLGFPESRRFFLRPHSAESPFMWLQSLDNPQLAFVVVQPELFLDDYTPALQQFVLEELQFSKDSDKEILVILTIPPGKPKEMTANLLGPVVINTAKRLAKQVLLDPGKYDPCRRVLQEN